MATKQKEAEEEIEAERQELVEYLEDDQIANVLRLLDEGKAMRARQMLRFYKWKLEVGL